MQEAEKKNSMGKAIGQQACCLHAYQAQKVLALLPQCHLDLLVLLVSRLIHMWYCFELMPYHFHCLLWASWPSATTYITCSFACHCYCPSAITCIACLFAGSCYCPSTITWQCIAYLFAGSCMLLHAMVALLALLAYLLAVATACQ